MNRRIIPPDHVRRCCRNAVYGRAVRARSIRNSFLPLFGALLSTFQENAAAGLGNATAVSSRTDHHHQQWPIASWYSSNWRRRSG